MSEESRHSPPQNSLSQNSLDNSASESIDPDDPTPGLSASEALPGDGSSELSKHASPGEHTGNPAENQDKMGVTQGPPLPSEEAFESRIARRRAAVEDELREKEALMLRFIYKQVRLEYYNRWKGDANSAFALAVKYRLRNERRSKKPTTP